VPPNVCVERRVDEPYTPALLSFRVRSNASLDGSSVDILPVANLENRYDAGLIVNEVDDPIITLPHAISVGMTGELLGAVRSRITRQSLNAANELLAIRLRINRGKFLACGGFDQNSI
jgi:hypothetical protein